VGLHVDLLPDLRDDAVGIDEVRDAFGIALGARRRRAVGEADLAVGVAQQSEREVELLGEVAVLVDGVEADPEDLDVLAREVFGLIAEPATLDRSTRRVGLRVEPEDHVVAAEIGEPDGGAAVIGDLEVGGFGAWGEHRGPW
jgi:hypothetical protein